MTRRLSPLLLGSLLALGACGKLNPPPPLATISGNLAAGDGTLPKGQIRVAMVWMTNQVVGSGGWYAEGSLSVAQEVEVEPVFPAGFKLELTAPPDKDAMVAFEDSALLSGFEALGLGEAPEGGRLAVGGVIAYEDVNGNGALDLVTADATEGIDKVVAASDTLAVLYFEREVLSAPDYFQGELALGYNLVQVPSCWFDPTGGPCIEPMKNLGIEAEITLSLSDGPALSHLMCQSFGPGETEYVYIMNEGPLPADAADHCSGYNAMAIEVFEGCQPIGSLCSTSKACTSHVWTFPDDEAGRIAWPCYLDQSVCEDGESPPFGGPDDCGPGMVPTDPPEDFPTDPSDPAFGELWCMPAQCLVEPWCHPDSLGNPCPTEAVVTLAEIEESGSWFNELRRMEVTAEHVVWQEHQENWIDNDCGKASCPPLLRNRFRRVAKDGGAPELLAESEGPANLSGVAGGRLYRRDFVLEDKDSSPWGWIPTQVCAVDLDDPSTEACVAIGAALVAVLPEQDAIVYRADATGAPDDAAGATETVITPVTELWRRPIAGPGEPVRLATSFAGYGLVRPEPIADGQLGWVEASELAGTGFTFTLRQAPWDGSGDATTLFAMSDGTDASFSGLIDGNLYLMRWGGDVASSGYYRMAMDTGEETPLPLPSLEDVKERTVAPSGLFFRDQTRGVIGRVTLDGANVETIVADPYLQGNHGSVFLRPDGDRLFWASPTNTGKYRIQSVPLP